MYKIYVDAATKRNPGPSAIGMVILNTHTKEYQQISHPLKNTHTNHEAEFEAVIYALEWINKQPMTDSIIWIHSDSKIVIQTIDKNFTKNECFKAYLRKINQLIHHSHRLIFFKWIPEKENKGADQLAKQGLLKLM